MSLVLNSAALGWLYPAHLITDSALTIRAFGPSIARAFPSIVAGESLWSHFAAERPLGTFDVARLLREREQVWLRSPHGLKLRGIIVDQGDELFFLVNYAPSTLRSDAHYQLQMWDFSPADATLDALIAVEVQKALIAETQDVLNELTAARAAAEASHQAARRRYDDLVGAEGASLAAVDGAAADVAAFAPLDVIAAACRLQAPLFRARGVTLQADIDPADDRLFLGDPSALSGAATAMLTHALKRSEQGWVKVNASAHTDGARLQVLVECLDTGATDAPDDDADLADAAKRLAPDGGRLERRVLSGVGVKTELKIGYRPASPAPMANVAGAGGQARPPFRLLVVGNDPADLRLIEATLPPPSVEMTVAATEEDVLSALGEQVFDLALFDIHSAAFDALSLSQAIRKRAVPERAPPIVVMGTSSVISHLDDDLTRHVDLWVAKPLSPGKLLRLLRQATGFAV